MDWREDDEGACALPSRRSVERDRGTDAVDERAGEGKWHGRLLLYAEDAHFVDSSRAPSPTANADVVE